MAQILMVLVGSKFLDLRYIISSEFNSIHGHRVVKSPSIILLIPLHPTKSLVKFHFIQFHITILL
jgi:hypothetical protein